MPSNKLKKLAAALATAAVLSTGAPSAQVLEVDSGAAMQQIASFAMEGDITAALAIVADLRALGVVQLIIDGRVVTLDELEVLLAGGLTDAELLVFAELLELAIDAEETDFVVAGTTTLADDDEGDDDTFPIGSEGVS